MSVLLALLPLLIGARGLGAAPVLSPIELGAQVGSQVSSQVGDTIRGDGLRPGDLVRLQIWRETDLSGEFVVDADGVVVLPKIGPQLVTGISQVELRGQIEERYRRYLRNPSIEVIFLRRINVLGSVRSPGLISVDPTMEVADVLALAGGVTAEGRQDRIELIRDGEIVTTEISQRTRIGDLELRSGDQLFVPERSWFSRHNVGGTLISAGLSLVTVLITIAITK